jgi:hypothetical protein
LPKKEWKQCPVCGKWKETVSATCSITCSRIAFPQETRYPDPSPEEIQQACAEIRKGWSAEETDRRWVAGGKSESGIRVVPTPKQRRGGVKPE